jgi:predicted nuclease of predicted toxin-antitoxin system
MPRSLAHLLRAEGFETEHVIDAGIRGRPDDEILEYAKLRVLVLVTGDLGFANLLDYPLGSHPGIVVARFPNELSNDLVNEAVASALKSVSAEELRGGLLIIQPGKLRLRRSP